MVSTWRTNNHNFKSDMLETHDNFSTSANECLRQNWNISWFDGHYCPAYWDDKYCWPLTPVGQNVTLPCTELMKLPHKTNNLKGNITRLCLENSTWYWNESSNYNSCSSHQTQGIDSGLGSIKEIIRYTVFVGSIAALFFLALALFIFTHFKSIRCHRITIHIHFMIALAIKSCVLILISDPTSFSDKYYYRDVDWICKLVILFQLYSYLASTNWMLIQGHFLNSKLSTDVFQTKSRLKCYYVFGWGIPMLLVLTWYILMTSLNRNHCWKQYSKSRVIWIIVAPMFIALLFNLLFLINIIRILLQKVQATYNTIEAEQFRRASKATAALFPLLGINNLIFFFNPGGSWVIYYMMTNAVLQPLQGIMVPVLYCFVCQDVRECLRREYGKYSARRSLNPSVRFHSGRSQSKSSRWKRDTIVTSLENTNDCNFNQNS